MSDRGATQDGLAMLPELAPHALHPSVVARGLSDGLLAASLGRYLRDTVYLERQVVNPVARWLLAREGRFALPGPARRLAERLHDDEEAHAAEAEALLAAVASDTQGAPTRTPGFAAGLAAVQARGDHEDRDLLAFLFVFVTETALSDRLRLLAEDERVLPDVREFVGRHGRDEEWHRAFFAERFAQVWGALTAEEQDRLGPALAELAVAYLGPDLDGDGGDLRAAGLADADAEAILADLWTEDAVAEHVRRAARATLGALEMAGALEHAATRLALAAAGLLDEGAL